MAAVEMEELVVVMAMAVGCNWSQKVLLVQKGALHNVLCQNTAGSSCARLDAQPEDVVDETSVFLRHKARYG